MMKFTTLVDTFHFISDLHMYHKNICRGVSKWDRIDLEESTRDFENEFKMTDHIIDNINKTVMWDHHLFILGDILFHFKRPEDYVKAFERINCDNIYIIIGNHDNRENIQQARHLMAQEGKREKINIVRDYLEISIDGRMLCLMHYPIENWNSRHKTSWHLHGHVHGRMNKNQAPNRLDVGIDSAYKMLGEYRPFEWKEIIKILS